MSEANIQAKSGHRRLPDSASEAAVDHFVLREDLRRTSVPINQFGPWRWHQMSFALCVALPTLIAGVYYGLVAADKYAVEFRFSVRSASDLIGEKDPIPMLIRGAGISEIGRLPYMITSYLRSKNAVRELDAAVSLRKLYSRGEADGLSRFNPETSEDKLSDYWQSMITVNVDRVSGLVLVRVLAFTPDDALAIAQATAISIEKMIDGVAARARHDALASAEKQLESAGARYAIALTGLQDIRNEEGIVDPQQTIDLAAKTLLATIKEKLSLERQRDVNLKLLSSQAPQQQVLNNEIQALETQIISQSLALTSQRGEARTAARTISEFEKRELDRRFSERLLEVAHAAYAKAREEAERQHIYLAIFVPPRKPDIAEYPRRIRSISLVGLSSFGLWSVLMVVIAGVRDHRNMS